MKNTDTIVWLDMDGVLVGFTKGYAKLSPPVPHKHLIQRYDQSTINKYYRHRRINFWANLPWEDGGQEVYKAAKKMFADVRILSSAGVGKYGPVFDQVAEGKMRWIKENGVHVNKVVIVPDSSMKQRYATPMSILVDDKGRNIAEWEKAGGTGIYHFYQRYMETILELKDLSTPIMMTELLKNKRI